MRLLFAVPALHVAHAAAPDGAASVPARVQVFVHDASGRADCPGAEVLSERLRVGLGLKSAGGALQAALQSSQAVFVSFAQRRGGIAVHISTAHSGDEPRELFEPSGNCARLTEAIVLTATLLLTPAEQDLHESTLPTPVPPARTPPPPARSAPAPVQVVVLPSPRVAQAPAGRPSALGATLLATSGALPEPQWGLGLDSRWALTERWSLRAGADYLPAVQVSQVGQAYRFSRSSLWAGVAWSVLLIRDGSLQIDSAATLGITHVAVIGDSGLDPGDFPFPGLRVGLSGAFAATPWLLGFAGARAEIPIIRNVFRSENVPDPIWSQSWVGLAAEVGLAWRSW